MCALIVIALNCFSRSGGGENEGGEGKPKKGIKAQMRCEAETCEAAASEKRNVVFPPPKAIFCVRA